MVITITCMYVFTYVCMTYMFIYLSVSIWLSLCVYAGVYIDVHRAETCVYNTVEYSRMQYQIAVQYDRVPYSTIQCEIIAYYTIQYQSIHSNIIQCNTIEIDMILNYITQYNVIIYNAKYYE